MMKKTTLSILSLFAAMLFLSSADAYAQQVVKEKKTTSQRIKKENTTPNLTWDKAKHVFGSIEHKHPVIAKFTFTNIGKKPIVITKVGTTCGCTAPIYSKEPVKPGEKGIVKIRFDAVAPGFFQKAAKIHFSDGSYKELEIEGKVQVRMSEMKKR